MFSWEIFQKMTDYIDFNSISSSMDHEFPLRPAFSTNQVQAVVYMYWRNIKKYGKIRRQKKTNDFKLDLFTNSSYKAIREIASELGLNKFDVENMFRVLYIGISQGFDWVKYLDPNLAIDIDKEKEKLNPDPLMDWVNDLKNQLIITGAVVGSGLALYLFKK